MQKIFLFFLMSTIIACQSTSKKEFAQRNVTNHNTEHKNCLPRYIEQIQSLKNEKKNYPVYITPSSKELHMQTIVSSYGRSRITRDIKGLERVINVLKESRTGRVGRKIKNLTKLVNQEKDKQGAVSDNKTLASVISLDESGLLCGDALVDHPALIDLLAQQ